LVSYNDKGVRWEPGSLPAIGDRVKDALVKTAILAVLSGCILERVSPVRISDFDLARLPAMPEALGDLVMLILLVDFMQYVIHWCFHKSDFLWKHVHSLHHREHTCTPLSTIRATLLDAFITHPVPLITAKFVLQPHPLIYFGAVFFILWDVVYVHSGIDAPWLNAMALEFLPFREGIWLHERHHKFSGRKATNLGLVTSGWDRLFGTLDFPNSHSLSSATWSAWKRLNFPVTDLFGGPTALEPIPSAR